LSFRVRNGVDPNVLIKTNSSNKKPKKPQVDFVAGSSLDFVGSNVSFRDSVNLFAGFGGSTNFMGYSDRPLVLLHVFNICLLPSLVQYVQSDFVLKSTEQFHHVAVSRELLLDECYTFERTRSLHFL